MNTAQLKVLSWSAALLFGAGLAGYVANYLMHRTVLEQRVTPETIKASLSKVPNVEKKAEDIVAYDKVNDTLYRYNWTGKPPPPPPKPAPPPDTTPRGPEPVANLVKVMMFKADATDDSGSRAVLKYLPAAKVTLKEPTVVKHVGDPLDEPWQSITIADITSEGVLFKFADANRKEELLTPGEFERRLDMEWLAANPNSSLPRPTEIKFPRGPNFDTSPKNTVKLDDNSYAIGTDDMVEWNDNYEQRLAEVEFERHRNPTTGKYDGVKLTSIPPGSLAASYGAQEGDVIKSINDHPVNSVQEAISWAKQNKDKYDTWVVEVESKGKTKFVTYKTPKKK
ncbi:MAG TPA: PDZ domain-containing protein [Planctomycetota bacterium]|nr:PDZ domain-containing protein [Planctomycetota bacterium]